MFFLRSPVDSDNVHISLEVMAFHRSPSRHLNDTALHHVGKNPAVVDSNCDLKVAAKRIWWGRILNAGQVIQQMLTIEVLELTLQKVVHVPRLCLGP